MTPELRRGLIRCAFAQLVLVGAAIRHRFVWGGDWAPWFNAAELGALVVATIVGVAGMVSIARHAAADTDGRGLFLGGVIVTALAVVAPPFLSTDVFDYVVRGRVEAVHGANPYLVPPSSFADDPVMQHAEWPEFVMPYGPLTATLQAVSAWLDLGAPWLGVYLLKLVFGACHLLTAWAVGRTAATLADGDAALGRRAFALWAFNPWLLLECAGSGHNEALMGAFLALCALAVVTDRWFGATLAFGGAVLTKHGCAPLGPLLLALAWRRGRLIPFAQGVVATGAVTALYAWRYFLEPGGLDWIAKQTGNRGASLQHFATLVVGDDAASTLLRAGYVVTLIALGFGIARTRDAAALGRAGSGVLLVFLAVAMPLFSPWYHLWWLPLVGLAFTPLGERALRILAVCGPLSYAAFAGWRSFALDHQLLQWTVAFAVPAVAVWLARPRATSVEMEHLA